METGIKAGRKYGTQWYHFRLMAQRWQWQNEFSVTETLRVKFQPSLGTAVATANQKYKSIIRMIMKSAKHLYSYQHVRLSRSTNVLRN